MVSIMISSCEIVLGTCIDYTTIRRLKNAGYQGVDACLYTSLYDYGFAYKQREDEYTIIHENPYGFLQFDTTNVPLDLDWQDEYRWIKDSDKASLMSYIDSTIEEFNKDPVPMQLYNLVHYYGVENIFGTPCMGFYVFDDGRSRRREYLDIQERKEMM
jgi:hypothetical protein